jgi:alpha-L-arabinofuranosidase
LAIFLEGVGAMMGRLLRLRPGQQGQRAVRRPAFAPAARSLRFERLEARLLLSADTWTGGSGSWTTASDWSAGVPTSASQVTIGTTSSATITISSAVSVNSLTVGSKDSLSITGGSLTTTSGLSNSGTITDAAGCDLTVGGSYSQAAGAALSMPGGGSLANPGTNDATNSDFESPVVNNNTPEPGSWSYWGSESVSKQYAYTGAQSLVMSGSNSGVVESIAATPGASYTVSADAMTPASDPLTGNETGQLELLFYNSSGTLLSSFAPPNSLNVLTSSSATGGPLAGSVGSQGWNHFNTTAVAPSGTATAEVGVLTNYYSGTGGGEVFWDDVELGPSAGGSSALAAGSISNSGTLTVGPTNTVSTTGTFTQTSSGTLDIQLGGAPSTGAFGFVNVTGAATLAGTLKSDLVYGYTPSTTDSFTPMEFASETGAFSNDSLPSSSTYQFAAAVTFTNVVVSAAPATAVTSTINANASVGATTTNLLGINLAYWDDQQGTTQTQQMVTAAGLAIYRFPGGSASDDFHFNVANNYGDSAANTIPQFAQFISSVGGTGVVTLDYGSGSPQEAAAELAYLQGSPTDTTVIGTGLEWNDTAGAWQSVNWETVGYWASLRAASPLGTDDGLNFLRIDHPAPFADIKYWEVGNEEYGSWEVDHHGTAGPGGVSTGSQHCPATYAAFAEQFATLATEITGTAGLPAISIGIDSEDPTGASDNNWTKNVLADGLSIGLVPGFISDHSYMQGPGAESDSFLLNDSVSDPGSLFDWSTRYADYSSLLQQTLGSKASSVTVMATEFNSVYTNPGKQSTSLVNGLFIADSIGSLLDSGYEGGFVWDLRNGWQTDDNNSNLLYGWREGGDYGQLGDPNDSDAPDTGPYVAYPGYYAVQLASKIDLAGGEVVSATSSYGDLDVYAVKEANGHLELLVINTNPAVSLTDQFNVTGFQPGSSAQVWQYGEAQDTAQAESTTGASGLAGSTATLSVSGTTFSYSFPAYSMTVLNLAPVPGVNPSGTHANYTAGAAAVSVDSGVKVTSTDTDLTGATVTIGTGFTTGDTLHFTSASGISGSYANGVLTLTGSATPAQYQAALQSVTFSSTSSSITARAISIVAIDSGVDSNAAAETVNVSAPVTITGAFVSGANWTTAANMAASGTEQFDTYLSTHGLGNATIPTLGYALQTGASQTTDLPWTNINTISVSFSGAVSNIGLGSLKLVGGTGGGAVAAPAVTSFASDGNNTYSWTLASPLGNNKYVLAIATTGSSFGTPGSTQVTDANGAGISGTFTTGSSSFPSGNGLAGSTFDFFFNVLPGDGKRGGTVNSADAAAASSTLNDHETTAGYSPYYDYEGFGLINSVDVAIAAANLNKTQSGITTPTAPSASQQVGQTGDAVGTTGFTALALGVQETGSSTSLTTGSPQTSGSQTSNASSASTTSASSTLAATPSASAASASNDGLGSAGSSTTAAATHRDHGRHPLAATDEAVSDFDLIDLYV